MWAELFSLFYNFFYVGAFAFGGGYAMIPLLQQIATEHGWLTAEGFTDMIAISQMTPGPIAVNMATYIGYQTAGVPGSLVATLSVCTPSFILVTLLIRLVIKYEDGPVMTSVLSVMRPVVAGLIAASAWLVAVTSPLVDMVAFSAGEGMMEIFDPLSVLLAGALIVANVRFKSHPILYVLVAGLIGALLM